jgi:uncharacterized membrane protein YphA (DoxX/SURF4 family)
VATGLDLALRAAVALVFLASSWPKLRRPRGFILTVLEYRVLPTSLAHLAGRTIPAAEFLVVLLLVSGVAVRPAAVLACLLLVGFMIGIAVNLARGRTIDCGCFGARKTRTIGWPVLLQDALLLGMAATIAILARSGTAAEGWLLFRPPRVDSAAGGVVLSRSSSCSVAWLSGLR